MQTGIFNSENIGSVDWEDQYYKFVEFTDFSFDDGQITSDFANCFFTNLDWYWGLFNVVNFVDCKFINCVFQGTSFADCKFVSCEFSDCKFIKDNLNGECDFDGSVAFDCKISNTEGFEAVIN